MREALGREEDIAFLDDAWTNQHINVVTIVAWAGVGKSSLVNHWLRRMAAERYRSAQLVFGWSFYRQGSSGQSSSADEFQSTTLFTTTALRRQLLEATADCYSKQWDLKAAGRRRSGLFNV